ncbi:hypothetical protein BDR26DRAFT_936087 [Obelidium mucronatum]|nr:hypothetical protein BDR26DRAFT_936087 [Obelidium mucronatum]
MSHSLDYELDQIQRHIREQFVKHQDQFPDIVECMFEFTMERFMYTLSSYKANTMSRSPLNGNKFMTRKEIRTVLWKSIEGNDPMHAASRIIDLCFPYSPGILMPGYNPRYVPQIAAMPPPPEMCIKSGYGLADNITEIAPAVEIGTRSSSPTESWSSAPEEVWEESETGYTILAVRIAVASKLVLAKLEEALGCDSPQLKNVLESSMRWFCSLPENIQKQSFFQTDSVVCNVRALSPFAVLKFYVKPVDNGIQSTEYIPSTIYELNKAPSWHVDELLIEDSDEAVDDAFNPLICLTKVLSTPAFRSLLFYLTRDRAAILEEEFIQIGLSSVSSILDITTIETYNLYSFEDFAPGDSSFFCERYLHSLVKMDSTFSAYEVFSVDPVDVNQSTKNDIINFSKRVPWKQCILSTFSFKNAPPCSELFQTISEILTGIMEACDNVIVLAARFSGICRRIFKAILFPFEMETSIYCILWLKTIKSAYWLLGKCQGAGWREVNQLLQEYQPRGDKITGIMLKYYSLYNQEAVNLDSGPISVLDCHTILANKSEFSGFAAAVKRSIKEWQKRHIKVTDSENSRSIDFSKQEIVQYPPAFRDIGPQFDDLGSLATLLLSVLGNPPNITLGRKSASICSELLALRTVLDSAGKGSHEESLLDSLRLKLSFLLSKSHTHNTSSVIQVEQSSTTSNFESGLMSVLLHVCVGTLPLWLEVVTTITAKAVTAKTLSAFLEAKCRKLRQLNRPVIITVDVTSFNPTRAEKQVLVEWITAAHFGKDMVFLLWPKDGELK